MEDSREILQQIAAIVTNLAGIQATQDAIKDDVRDLRRKVSGNGREGLDDRVTRLETALQAFLNR